MTGKLGVCVTAAILLAGSTRAAEYFVEPGGSGDGSSGNPFGSIQDGISAANAGDIVTVGAGTYDESLTTVRDGASGSPITVRAEPGGGDVVVTASGRVLDVEHAYVTFDGLTLDGQYGSSDLLRVTSGGDFLALRNCEIRKTSRDCVDMAGPEGVLVESCLIHRCLNAAGGRTDAHGITGGPVQNLTIRNTEIHTFSGDAVQFDPGRSAPGWSQLTIEGCHFWLAPLAAPENGFTAGTVPGENALDTKTDNSSPRAVLTIRDTVAHGFRGGLISNMAAFNLKENVDVLLDGVTVYDSEIAFRLRGPTKDPPKGAWVTLQNAVVYDVDVAIRYEDELESPELFNSTFGGLVGQAFKEAASDGTVFDTRNLLFLAPSLPSQVAGSSNLAVSSSVFLDAAADDYHLAAGSAPIDAGETVVGVAADRDGVARPQGGSYDVGAYEHCPGGCPSGALIFLDGFESGDTSAWSRP